MQASASVTASGDSKAAIGEALKQALAGIRLQSISLHDERGDVLWLDEGALGPDEHNIVMEAISVLGESAERNIHFQVIGDGRSAAFLPARSPLNELLGVAMIIADAKFMDSKAAAKFITPTSTNLMRRLAFLRRPPPPAAAAPPPAPAPAAAPANRVVSPPQAQPRPPAPKPAAPPAGAAAAARPAAPPVAQRPPQPAPAPAAQRPAAPAAPPARPAAPVAPPRAPQVAARPAAPPAKPLPPAAKPAAPPPRGTVPAAQNMQQRTSGSADSDSIAFEISDIDPNSLLKGATSRAAPPEAKRPDLRVVQTDRLPRLQLNAQSEPVPELISDDSAPLDLPQIDTHEEVTSEEETTEVAAIDDPENNMNVEPEYVEEAQAFVPEAGQFEYYGQIFELHVQQLVKLKGSGGTRRFEVLVRDANADNEFGVAPERVMQDVHDPSANSDLDRIVVEQLARWMGENRAVWETEPASFSVNVGMGTIADPKFASYVAGVLKNQKVPAKALGFEITEKSCVEQAPEVEAFILACEKLGCHVALDDFTFHHNSMRWLGSSALKFLKLDAKITAVAMKERVPQAMVVAIAQASKVLGLSCVAKRVDTPAVRDWLSAVGLDYAQGFLLDQPKPLRRLIAPAGK
jgi:EAL domain-containing protein (putative c-di-GMP-specific phosphodiesterase class I)